MYSRTDAKPKINTFKDLYSWQEAHQLVLGVYKATNSFPSEENFVLTSQMRRSAISITSNIAEGFSRKTNKDKAQFFTMGLGSLTELQSQITTSKDLGYLSVEAYEQLDEQSIKVHKLINGLIKSSKLLTPHT